MDAREVKALIGGAVGIALLVLLLAGLLVLVLRRRVGGVGDDIPDRVMDQVLGRSARGTWLGLAFAVFVSVSVWQYLSGYGELAWLLIPFLATFGSCLFSDLAGMWAPAPGQRRAPLTSRSWRDVLSRTEVAIAGVLGFVTLGGGTVAALQYHAVSGAGECFLPVQVDGFPWVKGYYLDAGAIYQAIVLSGLVTALTVVGLYRAVHRPVIDELVDVPNADLALRRLSAHRVLGVGIGAQLVLLAVLVPATQVGSAPLACTRTAMTQGESVFSIITGALAAAGVVVWLIMAVLPMIRWNASVERRSEVG
ncbi:hypothetical protein [Allokutzneria albata]|uniref:Uncharacterized protein n=1 Tax=Allokutzneria albata TaxID=211114 RepID=A0A1G9VHM2_ALLAB|nr:hypothetical protein [Allokutzneria albata]SDM71567.1 hypothetical protein SAMN04489726_3040 [Allokutzneria albata]